MTSKTKKFSLGVKIASILTCVALTAVGFASWLIIKPAETKTETGSFTVYTVEENNITITVAVKEGSNSTIIWGKGAEPQTPTASPWLLTTDVANENLSATFTVTVTSTKGTGGNVTTGMPLDDIISTINVGFEMVDSENLYSTAMGNGYVSAPTIKVKDNTAKTWSSNSASDTLAPTADATTMSFDVVVTFAWGTNGNPYTYYNGQAYTETLATQAKACLDAVNGLKEVGYKLTFSTTAKTTASGS